MIARYSKTGDQAFLAFPKAGTARRLLEVRTPSRAKLPAETAANGGTSGHLQCLALDCGRAAGVQPA